MILAHLDWQTEAAPILNQMRIRDRAAYPSELEVFGRKPQSDAATTIGIKAWGAVSSCRQIGFGIGPIPQDAIDNWCDRHIKDPIAADFLDGALRYVDNVVLEREAAKHKKG